MDDQRRLTRAAVVEFGLGLLVIAAGALGALALLAGVIALVIVLVVTRP